jgi:hypothetical protein
MQPSLNLAFAVFCVILGVVWAIDPMLMGKLQQRFLFFGAGGDEVQINETIGRIAGIVLALVGLYVILV